MFSVTVFNRLVVLESGLGLESGLKSIFAGVGLETAGLGLGVGNICNQVQFQFSLCTSAVYCLGCMTFCQPVSYTQVDTTKAACCSSVNLGRHTVIYVVLICCYWCILQLRT